MENMKLTFVNVGYGEAILLEAAAPDCKDGVFTMLIDAGGANESEFMDRSSGRIPMVDYLTKHGITHIDCAVITHIHEDHICGMLPCLTRWVPSEIWQTCPDGFYREVMYPLKGKDVSTLSQSNFVKALNAYRTICGMIPEERIRCRKYGDSGILPGGISYHVLAPTTEAEKLMTEGLAAVYTGKPESVRENLDRIDCRLNNFSLMLLLEYKGTRILLPGDTNRTGFGYLQDEEIRADIYKVGHHGQVDGTDEVLMNRIRPKSVVCCASSDRRYNSAYPDTIRMIGKYSSLYYSDCPLVPVGQANPHAALVFDFGSDGSYNVSYQ